MHTHRNSCISVRFFHSHVNFLSHLKIWTCLFLVIHRYVSLLWWRRISTNQCAEVFRFVHLLKIASTVFWYVTLCSLAEVYRCFRGSWCLHPRGRCVIIYPDNWCIRFFWNVCALLPHYTASQPRSQQSHQHKNLTPLMISLILIRRAMYV